MSDLDWMTDALCTQVDPDLFFPGVGDPGRDAKSICAACDVREQCKAFALEGGEYVGIWGGVSGVSLIRERSRQRKIAA